MPIARVKSRMDAPSYPLRQNTLSAVSRERSTSNLRGRPLATPKPPPFCACRYFNPLDRGKSTRLCLPVGTKSLLQEIFNVTQTGRKDRDCHRGVQGNRRLDCGQSGKRG